MPTLRYGSNAAGQTQGLLGFAGITSITYTDASPTVAETVAEIYKLYSQMSLKCEPDLIVMHPRRFAWLNSQPDTTGTIVAPKFPCDVVTSAGVPVTLGGGTEDAILMVDRDKVELYRSSPVFTAKPQPNSGNGAVRCGVHYYMAVLPVAKAVGKIQGSGLAANAGF